ncbi:MAG: T9SS type A sorting domain-containing protein [Bacteroidetes bacterium]|nr:T9SS type A sorting domain-containing protein [Bacteroidota bacterium]
MKAANKWSLPAVVFLLSLSWNSSYSQNAATPNPGFENWTQVGNHYDPNNWNCLNPSTAILGVFTCIRATGVDVHTGNYAIKLTTKSVFGIKANGIASTATLITTPPYGVTGGIPYTQRPDSIVGWYKYNPASAADSGFVEIVLLDAGNDTVGFARFDTPNSSVTTYTRFSKAITYFSPDSPVLSYWVLTSSDGTNPIVNSTLFVDDLDLVFNPSSISDGQASNTIQLLNTIAGDVLLIENTTPIASMLQIFDNAGRLVLEADVLTGANNLNVTELKSGLYFYSIFNPISDLPVIGKFVKL